jgi:hypothetical protein
MKQTIDSGTRWRLVVYKYQNDFPTTTDLATERRIVSKGVESISIRRAKGDPNGGCSISVIGDIDDSLFIGNWVVVRKRMGAWKQSDGFAAGLPVFVGQVTNVSTDYRKDPNGMFTRRSSVTLRQWSTAFQCPVRYDLFAAANYFSDTDTAQISLVNSTINTINGDVYTNMSALAAEVYNPWTYVGVAMKFIGALNANKEGVFSSAVSSSLELLKEFPEVAVKMPSVPKELLEDLGLDNVEPKSPFSSGEGMASLCIGVLTAPILDNPALEKNTGVPKAFSGLFRGIPSIENQYEITSDRPLKTNCLLELTHGETFWNLITTRTDPEMHETFVDTWYYDMGDGDIGARPVLVFRDKPYALRKYFDQMDGVSAFSSKWTKFDDVPRVYVNNAAIRDIQLSSTFFNSPNYMLPQISPGAVGNESFVNQVGMGFARVRLGPEITRFGGIEYQMPLQFAIVDSVSMPKLQDGNSQPWSGTVGNSSSVNVNWYRDVAQISYLWHGLNYRFLSGSMVLEDDNTPLMVGNNITWKMGPNVLCAQVDAVSYAHSSDPSSGRHSTTVNVGFSYCCLVQSDGSLALLGPSAMNDIFDAQVEDNFSTRLPAGLGITSFQEQLKKFETLRKAIQSAQEGFKKVAGRILG